MRHDVDGAWSLNARRHSPNYGSDEMFPPRSPVTYQHAVIHDGPACSIPCNGTSVMKARVSNGTHRGVVTAEDGRGGSTTCSDAVTIVAVTPPRRVARFHYTIERTRQTTHGVDVEQRIVAAIIHGTRDTVSGTFSLQELSYPRHAMRDARSRRRWIRTTSCSNDVHGALREVASRGRRRPSPELLPTTSAGSSASGTTDTRSAAMRVRPGTRRTSRRARDPRSPCASIS